VSGNDAIQPARLREQGDVTQNPLVQPGDRISVGQACLAAGRVQVSGGQESGSFPLDASLAMRISEVVESVGRWTEEGNAGSAAEPQGRDEASSI
jgi:hypothetical protein